MGHGCGPRHTAYSVYNSDDLSTSEQVSMETPVRRSRNFGLARDTRAIAGARRTGGEAAACDRFQLSVIAEVSRCPESGADDFAGEILVGQQYSVAFRG